LTKKDRSITGIKPKVDVVYVERPKKRYVFTFWATLYVLSTSMSDCWRLMLCQVERVMPVEQAELLMST